MKEIASGIMDSSEKRAGQRDQRKERGGDIERDTHSQNTGEPVDEVEKLNVRVRVRACVRARACMRVRVCAHACVCASACVRVRSHHTTAPAVGWWGLFEFPVGGSLE